MNYIDTLVGVALRFFNVQHSTLLACSYADCLWAFSKQASSVCLR